jgi:hypothetical protein
MVQRNAVWALNYGIGRTKETFTHDGDNTITIVKDRGGGTSVDTQTLVIGGEAVEGKDMEGKTVNVTAAWDGDVLVITNTLITDGTVSVVIRRWLDGDKLIREDTVKGVQGQRIFAKSA